MKNFGKTISIILFILVILIFDIILFSPVLRIVYDRETKNYYEEEYYIGKTNSKYFLYPFMVRTNLYSYNGAYFLTDGEILNEMRKRKYKPLDTIEVKRYVLKEMNNLDREDLKKRRWEIGGEKNGSLYIYNPHKNNFEKFIGGTEYTFFLAKKK